MKLPSKSFFLFGPRGTGKSTWLKDQYKADLVVDLLSSQQYLELSASPALLENKVKALGAGSKIVIDEIQRVPELLNEVHRLLFESKNEYKFALTGSSARKLKKQNVNLLAGRAVNRSFFPLTYIEYGDDFSIEEILQYGTLPEVLNTKNKSEKIDYLYSYVENYLIEEIQAEAAVRNLATYNRFLKHAALMNAQVLNLNNLSKDASVARSTLDGYFGVLEETLLGYYVEPIHLKAKVKEVSTAKFYFFDCGVARALRNELTQDMESQEKGFLLETYLLTELKAFNNFHQKHWEIHYWGTPSQNEVDFIISEGKNKFGIEVKASKTWKPIFNKGLKLLIEEKKISKAIGIYLGDDKLKDGEIMIYPIRTFLKELYKRGEL